MSTEGATDAYVTDDDPDRVDRGALWAFLSEQAYWGRWRARADVERQLDASWRVVTAHHVATGAMVGFARAVSDGVAYAYLADLYVDPAHRGRGLGARLVATMVDNGPGARFRWALHTADAHGLYARFGFTPPDAQYLERPGRPAREAGTPPPTEGPTVADLFAPEPVQWGLRGDRVLWTRLRDRGRAVPLTRELDVPALLHGWFRELVGVDPETPPTSTTTSGHVYRPELDGGHGMSRGHVHVPTWTGRLLPLLVERARATQRHAWLHPGDPLGGAG